MLLLDAACLGAVAWRFSLMLVSLPSFTSSAARSTSRQVTPRDYLETALQPLQGTGRAVEAKNQVRARCRGAV